MPASSASPDPAARGGGWVVAQALLIAAIVVAGLTGPAWGGVAAWLALPVGAALLALGGILVLLGARGLGRGLSPYPRPRPGATLVSHGVYARVRHPIYGGMMVGAPGWSLLTASPTALALSAALVVLLVLKTRREEEWLTRELPGYAHYRRRVRRRFLPWLV